MKPALIPKLPITVEDSAISTVSRKKIWRKDSLFFLALFGHQPHSSNQVTVFLLINFTLLPVDITLFPVDVTLFPVTIPSLPIDSTSLIALLTVHFSSHQLTLSL